MKAVIKSDFKIFWRSIYLPIVYILLAGILNVSLILLHVQSLRNASYSISNYFRQSQQFGFLVFPVLLFVAFEYMQRAKISDIMETLEGCKKGVIKMFFGKFGILLSMVLFIFLNIFTYDLVYYLASGLNFWPVLSNIIACDLLNYFFVGLIAILAGSLFALRFGRVGGYTCILLINFLMLPISNYFIVSLSQGTFNLKSLKELLHIQAPSLQAGADSLYGQAAELFRWVLVFFWIALIVLGILRVLARRKGMMIQIISVLLAAGCVFSLSYLLHFTGIVRKGDIGSSYITERFTLEDWLFYGLEWPDNIKAADFQVTAYSLELTITDQLSAKVKIEVDKKLSKYIFTLYHGYKVQNVVDEQGNLLEYTQYGDYLDISANDSINSFIVTYQGFNTFNYSNDQAVFLPGYFAYYPIPGHCQIYDDATQTYVPAVDQSEKSFILTLQGPMTLYTNLKEDTGHPGTYTGKASSLTLVGGLAKEVTGESFRLITLPAERMMTKINIDAVNQKIQEYCDYLGIEEDLSLPDNYTVFYTPIYLAIRNPVIFSDHAVLSSYPSNSSLAAAQVIGNCYSSPEKAKLARVLAEYVADPLAFRNSVAYQSSNDRFADRIAGEIIPYTYGVGDSTKIKILLAIDKLGEDDAVKTIYHYLNDKTDARDPEDFLEEVSGWREELAKYAENR